MLTVEKVQRILQNNMRGNEKYIVHMIPYTNIMEIRFSVVINNQLIGQNVMLSPETLIYHSPGTLLKSLVDKFRAHYTKEGRHE